MKTDEKDRLLDHDFDGIQEFDNPIPLWLNLILFGSVVFSVVYYMYFQIGPLLGTNGWTVVEAYDSAKAENLRLRFAEIGELKTDEATLIEYMQPEKREWLAVGQTVYKTNCQSCHAANGSGLVGPNLTDDYYKGVQTLTDLVTVIADGAANGAMPAWRNRLHPNELVLAAAYVASMRGQNLTGPRPAEGKEIPPWPTAVSEAPADDAPASDAGEAPRTGTSKAEPTASEKTE
jgi:cytochrome c oxidase cbb3-type subunit 3